jgi:hypothetical protein
MDEKMADGVTRDIEDALNKIVNTTEQSGNMRKELKKTIFETVSTLRNLFMTLKVQLEGGKSEKVRLERELQDTKTTLDECNKSRIKTTTEKQPETSRDKEEELPKTVRGSVLLPHQHLPELNHKLYSDAVAGRGGKKFTLMLRTKDNHTPEEIIRILKDKVNPAEIKVGITSLRTMRDGRVLIGAGSKHEIDTIGDKIRAECEETLEVSMQKLRKPRMIIRNTPEEITVENIVENLAKQNTELDTERGNIVPSFCYTTKRGTRNIVIEVNSETRKIILHSRVRLGWTMCKVEDYLVAKRCFRCSRYNHTHRECKGEEVCPLCTEKHKLKECKAAVSEHKCINCITYNKHHPHMQINIAHSSLDKKCPSLTAVLDKYRKNIDY